MYVKCLHCSWHRGSVAWCLLILVVSRTTEMNPTTLALIKSPPFPIMSRTHQCDALLLLWWCDATGKTKARWWGWGSCNHRSPWKAEFPSADSTRKVRHSKWVGGRAEFDIPLLALRCQGERAACSGTVPRGQPARIGGCQSCNHKEADFPTVDQAWEHSLSLASRQDSRLASPSISALRHPGQRTRRSPPVPTDLWDDSEILPWATKFVNVNFCSHLKN